MVGRTSGIWRSVLRRYSSAIRARGQVLRKFARKIGLVYFGVVDQHTDEHELIRGLTISTTHRDTHYAVGSYDGYDVSMVDRFDIYIDPSGAEKDHNWVILQIGLERVATTPHLFLKPIGPQAGAYDRFFSATHNLHPVNALLIGQHSSEFHSRYELYTAAAHAVEAEELLTTEVTQQIAARFWPHAVEIYQNKLYFYITDDALTEQLLETALSAGLWLARIVDESEEEV